MPHVAAQDDISLFSILRGNVNSYGRIFVLREAESSTSILRPVSLLMLCLTQERAVALLCLYDGNFSGGNICFRQKKITESFFILELTVPLLC